MHGWQKMWLSYWGIDHGYPFPLPVCFHSLGNFQGPNLNEDQAFPKETPSEWPHDLNKPCSIMLLRKMRREDETLMYSQS